MIKVSPGTFAVLNELFIITICSLHIYLHYHNWVFMCKLTHIHEQKLRENSCSLEELKYSYCAQQTVSLIYNKLYLSVLSEHVCSVYEQFNFPGVVTLKVVLTLMAY